MSNKHRKNKFPLTRLALVGAIATSILSAISGPVRAAYLSNWRFDPQRRQLEFTLPPGATPTYSLSDEPTPRLIVNIPDTQVGTNVTELYPDSVVRKVSLKEVAPERARIIIEFAPEVVLSPDLVQLQRVGSNNSWLLRPLIADAMPLSQSNRNREVRGTRSPLFELPTSAEGNEERVLRDSLAIASTPAEPPVEISVPEFEETIISRESTFDPNFPPISEPPFPSRETISLPPQTVSQERELANIDFGRPLPDSGLQRSPQSANQRSIEFGQPLPESGERGAVEFGEPLPETDLERSLLVLEEGDTLELVFPRGEDITLPRGIEFQEVLLLRSAIVDKFGRIVVPANTPVIGGFESSRNGSRFIARGLYLYGRTIPMAGRSELIEGRRRVDPKILAGATAAGGLGLLLLTGSGLGLLGGAAAGAGTVYATSPKAVNLEPAEIVEIRLTDDLPQSIFLGNR